MSFFKIKNTGEIFNIGHLTYIREDIRWGLFYDFLDGNLCRKSLIDYVEKLTSSKEITEQEADIISDHLDAVIMIHSDSHSFYTKQMLENVKRFSDFCFRASENGGFIIENAAL